MSTVIHHASKDERGKYTGGKAGDQTGQEVFSRAWYSRPWTAVYEPPTEDIGKQVAVLSKDACDNDCIGYDQGQRNTLLEQAKKCIWSLRGIKTLCECDCSSLACIVVIAATEGACESTLYSGGNCKTSSTIGAALKKLGWKEHTEKKYLKSSDYLGEGWILVAKGKHVAINGTKGRCYASGSSSANSGADGGICPYAEPKTAMRKGKRGTGVSWVQWHLNALIDKGVLLGVTRLDVDGSWGNSTDAVFKVFQTLYPETGTSGKPDGSCGPACRKKLKACVAEVAKEPTIHTVQKNETLSSIARKYKTTVAALVKANGIKTPNSIMVGQKIKVN